MLQWPFVSQTSCRHTPYSCGCMRMRMHLSSCMCERIYFEPQNQFASFFLRALGKPQNSTYLYNDTLNYTMTTVTIEIDAFMYTSLLLQIDNYMQFLLIFLIVIARYYFLCLNSLLLFFQTIPLTMRKQNMARGISTAQLAPFVFIVFIQTWHHL